MFSVGFVSVSYVLATVGSWYWFWFSYWLFSDCFGSVSYVLATVGSRLVLVLVIGSGSATGSGSGTGSGSATGSGVYQKLFPEMSPC